MNISELEARVGITKQNIRFYEKRGLLHPARDVENNYRSYTEEDVEALCAIKVLRKLDISIEDIRSIFLGEKALSCVLEEQLLMLDSRRKELDASIEMCRTLQGIELDSLDAGQVLIRMEEMEQKGGTFMSIIDDYRKVAKGQSKRSFVFTPDTMVENKQEFTEALFQYADKNHLNLVITKESMYPVFEIDGVEYTASREWRPGRPPVAYVVCTMTHPEEADSEDADVPKERKLFLRFFNKYMGLILILVFILITRPEILSHWWGWAILISFAPLAYRMLRMRE